VSGAVALTARELAATCGVQTSTIKKWERSGLPVATRGRKGKPSLYSEQDARAWLSAREEAARAPGAQMDVAQERAKKEHWQALLAEQTHRARERELLPRAEVEKAWGAERDAVRTKILASYTTHADRVHRASTLDGLPGVEKELKALAYEILRELSGEVVETKPRRGKAKAA
jgi:phage terminase Nu1 subunit (DNA packaging protein)